MLSRNVLELYRGGDDWQRELALAVEAGDLEQQLRQLRLGAAGPPRRSLHPHPSPMMQGALPIEVTRRFLRIQLTGNHGDVNAFAASQLTCHQTVGGPDVLAGSGATITATSTLGGTSLSNLTDSNDSTIWASTTAATQNIVIDWGAGAGKDIPEIGFKGRNDSSAYGQSPFSGNTGYSSDNSSYTTDWSWPAFMLEQFASGTTLALQKIRRTSLFPSTGSNHRIWGIKWNASSANPPELAQLELRASLGGASICTGGKAVSSIFFNNGFSPSKAFDGVSSQWAAVSIAHSYLGYDFLEGNEKPKPAQIAIKASSIPSRAPTDFDLWYQDGVGGAITIQQNFTTPATWAAGETRLWTVT